MRSAFYAGTALIAAAIAMTGWWLAALLGGSAAFRVILWFLCQANERADRDARAAAEEADAIRGGGA